MKLVAEQVEYLRKRKRELEGKKEEYKRYCRTREKSGLDGVDTISITDFQEEVNNSHARGELQEIEHTLSHSELIIERNFDFIDIGTAFYVRFHGIDNPERTMIVDSKICTNSGAFYASSISDFGQAVLGHKEGETITYTVKATGRKITVTIDQIDCIREHYAHFIREQDFTKRISDQASKELKRLKTEYPEEYKKRHSITTTQELLLLEELRRINTQKKNLKNISRKGHINRILRESSIEKEPTGNGIQIGSIVEIALKENNEIKTQTFEMINRAVSTETEGEFVEWISPLGQVLFGLKAGDKFSVKRCHQPNIQGMVVSVENNNQKERVR